MGHSADGCLLKVLSYYSKQTKGNSLKPCRSNRRKVEDQLNEEDDGEPQGQNQNIN